MKPDFIDNIDFPPDSDPDPIGPYQSTHHLLLTFWFSDDCDVLRKTINEEFDDCFNYYEDSFTNFITTDRGNLSIFDIPVDCLFDIDDDNNLSDDHASLVCFFRLLRFFSHKSITPINISLILKKNTDKNDKYDKNSNYCIFHQERIYKNEINIIRCRALFDKINEFIKENEWIYFESICSEIEYRREDYVKEKVINKDFLTIENLSSSKDIPQKSKEVMENIIKTGRSQFLTEFDCLLPYHEEDPLPIHIYLKKPEDMPEYNDLWKEIKDDDKDKYIPQGKVLGYYTRKEKGIEESPLIVLCPENIEKSSGPISVDNLYALVLVHELSHAILDRYYEYKLYNSIYENWNIEEIKVGQCWPYSLYSKAMEESLANMMALMWIMSYNNLPLFDQSLKFISNQQPAIYQFGISQYLANVDWKKWRNSPKNMKSLEEWFRTFFKDGNIIIQNDTVLPAFNAVFTAKEE
jgi:hypothetical protein